MCKSWGNIFYIWCLQNKLKRPDTKSPGGKEVVKGNMLAPDTGQSVAEEKPHCSEDPQVAAVASSSSPTSNNNNSNNYNLVTSLLNLTKSPVSFFSCKGFWLVLM